MKALSIQQPWAYCITHGTKRVENRTWYAHHRGPVLIHAGKKRDGDPAEWLEWFTNEDAPHAGLPSAPVGALVGVARLIECVSDDEVVDVTQQRGWANGPWCFVLADVLPFTEPIPWKGMLGFFDVPNEIVRTAIAAARERAANEAQPRTIVSKNQTPSAPASPGGE